MRTRRELSNAAPRGSIRPLAVEIAGWDGSAPPPSPQAVEGTEIPQAVPGYLWNTLCVMKLDVNNRPAKFQGDVFIFFCEMIEKRCHICSHGQRLIDSCRRPHQRISLFHITCPSVRLCSNLFICLHADMQAHSAQ